MVNNHNLINLKMFFCLEILGRPVTEGVNFFSVK
jgi:hypothetical protein